MVQFRRKTKLKDKKSYGELKVSYKIISSKGEGLKMGRAEARKCPARIAKRLPPPTLPQSVTHTRYWRLTNRETSRGRKSF